MTEISKAAAEYQAQDPQNLTRYIDYYNGAQFILASAEVTAFKSASEKLYKTHQNLIIQFNGSVPGKTAQEVFDDAVMARGEYDQALAAFDKLREGK